MKPRSVLASLALATVLVPSHGVLNVEQLEKLTYKMKFVRKPLLDGTPPPEGVSVVRMATYDGTPYDCRLPIIDTEMTAEAQPDRPQAPSFDDYLKMLEPMKALRLIYREGWWTYEYLHGREVEQYHSEDGTVRVGDEYRLGVYDEARSKEVYHEATSGNQEERTFYSLFYVNGTMCPEEGVQRASEVRFYCAGPNAEEKVVTVEEDKTCAYIIKIHTRRICEHPWIVKPAQAADKSIECQRVMSQGEYDRYAKAVFMSGPVRAGHEARLVPPDYKVAEIEKIIIFMNDGVYINGERLEEGDSDLASAIYASLDLDQDQMTGAQKAYIDAIVRRAEQFKKSKTLPVTSGKELPSKTPAKPSDYGMTPDAVREGEDKAVEEPADALLEDTAHAADDVQGLNLNEHALDEAVEVIQEMFAKHVQDMQQRLTEAQEKRKRQEREGIHATGATDDDESEGHEANAARWADTADDIDVSVFEKAVLAAIEQMHEEMLAEEEMMAKDKEGSAAEGAGETEDSTAEAKDKAGSRGHADEAGGHDEL